jgi:ribosomal protein S12 methylthiotransferase
MAARRDQLMGLQQPISFEKNQQEVGKIVDVLNEHENPESGELIGRRDRFSPEVDGQVYVKGQARLGTIVKVAIESADAYDLYGQIVNSDMLSSRLLSTVA